MSRWWCGEPPQESLGETGLAQEERGRAWALAGQWKVRCKVGWEWWGMDPSPEQPVASRRHSRARFGGKHGPWQMWAPPD